MITHRKSLTSGIFLSAIAVTALATSCIKSDFAECPNTYRAAFRYDMNASGVDAFPSQVTSVSVHVFDARSGSHVLSTMEYGDPICRENYRMPLELTPGSYDVIVWGGTHSNPCFSSPGSSPASVGDLSVSLIHDGISASLLQPVFHGKTHMVLTDNNLTGSVEPQTVTVSLVKNTNRVNVHLLCLDGEALREGDFEVCLTASNAVMAHDNTVSGTVVYKPWAVSVLDDYTTGTSPESKITGVNAPRIHRSELSTGRLIATAHSNLEVFRAGDGERIISIPLEDNLLQYRKEYFSSMGEQEYLDRHDDFDISFILTEDNGWNPATNIYINRWAAVPIQFVDW